MADWGSGWLFAPDHYPTGEELFQTGASWNSGGYSNPTDDANILATTTGKVGLARYENYLARQLPVGYQPDLAASLTEIEHGLAGVTPQNVLWQLNPENWRWSR